MNNNIFSNAWWWLRSRDTGALIFVAILAALLVFLLAFVLTRGGDTTETSEFDVSANPTTAPDPTPVPVATAVPVEPAPTISVPTPIPTAVPTAALNTSDLVDGADNAESVTTPTPEGGETTGEATDAAAATATPAPTNTPVPSTAAAPTAAPAPTATATATATATPGTPEPTPTPCIRGSGGFCVAAGDVGPATAVTATPTPGPATTPTVTATPLPVAAATGDINFVCGDDGSLTITFFLINPADGASSVTAQPVVPGLPPAAIIATAGNTQSGTTTLPAGYVMGEASLTVDQVSIVSAAVPACPSSAVFG